MLKEYDIKIETGSVMVGFGWDAFLHQRSGGLLSGLIALRKPRDVDFDGSAILLNEKGKPISSETMDCCVYYRNLKMFDGAMRHGGDDRSGAREGDDETLFIDLTRLPEDIHGIALSMDLLKDPNRHISIGRVQNVYVRLTDPEDGSEICRYSFMGEGGRDKAFVAGYLLRNGDSWYFRMDGSTLPDVHSTEEMIAAVSELDWEK